MASTSGILIFFPLFVFTGCVGTTDENIDVDVPEDMNQVTNDTEKAALQELQKLDDIGKLELDQIRNFFNGRLSVSVDEVAGKTIVELHTPLTSIDSEKCLFEVGEGSRRTYGTGIYAESSSWFVNHEQRYCDSIFANIDRIEGSPREKEYRFSFSGFNVGRLREQGTEAPVVNLTQQPVILIYRSKLHRLQRLEGEDLNYQSRALASAIDNQIVKISFQKPLWGHLPTHETLSITLREGPDFTNRLLENEEYKALNLYAQSDEDFRLDGLRGGFLWLRDYQTIELDKAVLDLEGRGFKQTFENILGKSLQIRAKKESIHATFIISDALPAED